MKRKIELLQEPIRLMTKEELNPSEEITPEKIGRKRLSQQEREERKIKFERILQSENK
jgi:hypothetical protein